MSYFHKSEFFFSEVISKIKFGEMCFGVSFKDQRSEPNFHEVRQNSRNEKHRIFFSNGVWNLKLMKAVQDLGTALCPWIFLTQLHGPVDTNSVTAFSSFRWSRHKSSSILYHIKWTLWFFCCWIPGLFPAQFSSCSPLPPALPSLCLSPSLSPRPTSLTHTHVCTFLTLTLHHVFCPTRGQLKRGTQTTDISISLRSKGFSFQEQ